MLEIPSGRRQQVERRQGLLKREASKLYLQEQQQQVLDHYLDQKGLPRLYRLYPYQNSILLCFPSRRPGSDGGSSALA